MRVCIHRGTREIGGTCAEIESQGKRIVLDIGLPLDSPEPDGVPLPPVPGFLRPDESLLGVVISHPHQDHYGLAPRLPKDTHFLIGPAAQRILETASLFLRKQVAFRNVTHLADRKPIRLGPFTITPYLVDHSAYDAYAVLVKADGKRLFYSGDFRAHGRTAWRFERMVAHPPKNIEVLLMEGTTLGREGAEKAFPSEDDLIPRFVELFRATPGLALVCCSGQNIDRLVTVYKAAIKARRKLILDGYTAHILRSTGNPRLPQSNWDEVRVYWPENLRWMIKKTGAHHLIDDLPGERIFREEIAASPDQYVMLFRSSMRNDFGRKDLPCLAGASLIYSLWPGYLDAAKEKPFLDWLVRHNIPLHHCHTSGHASPLHLKSLAKAIGARIVPVHTFHPEQVRELSANVDIREDRHWWDMDCSSGSTNNQSTY